MNPLDRLEAARAAWMEATIEATCMRGTDREAHYLDAEDAAHNAYLVALEDAKAILSTAHEPRSGFCPHCYGTGADPGGDSGLEFTWRCEACDGEGIARKRPESGEEET